MAILETLYTVLKLDASGLKKGADDIQSATKKIDHALDTTARHSEHLGHAFHHLKRELTGLVFSFLSVGSLVEGIKSSFEYATKVSEASDALKVNVEQLDAWDNAVVKAGGSAEGFQQSIKGLAKHFSTTNETAIKILPKIASVFEKMTVRQSTNYGKLIGLDEPTILLLQKGRREVDAIIAKQKELGVITKQDKEIVTKFNDAWGETAQKFRKAAFIAETGILPVFTQIIEKFGDIANSIKEHSNFIIGSLIAIGSAALIMGSSFLIPIAIIGGLSSAFGLLYEDIRAFNKGQESLIGNMIKKWPLLGLVVNITARIVSEAFKDWIDKIKYLYDFLSRIISKIIKAESAILNFEVKIFKKSKDYLNKNNQGFFEKLNLARNSLTQASSNPLTSQTSASIAYGNGYGVLKPQVNKNTHISIGDINIQTQATDAEGIRSVLSKTLQDHLFQSNSNFDDGQLI